MKVQFFLYPVIYCEDCMTALIYEDKDWGVRRLRHPEGPCRRGGHTYKVPKIELEETD
jgi:hypothetical protein